MRHPADGSKVSAARSVLGDPSDGGHPPGLDEASDPAQRLGRLSAGVGPVDIESGERLARPGPLVAVVCSHLGHDPRRRRHVARLVTRAVLDCRARGGELLIANGSAIAELAERAGQLFGVGRWRLAVDDEPAANDRLIRIRPAPDRTTARDGVRGVARDGSAAGGALSRDAAVIALADRVDAVFVRRGGLIESCLASRLATASDASTRVAVSGDSGCAAAGLIAAGAVGWYLAAKPIPAPPSVAVSDGPRKAETPDLRDPARHGPGPSGVSLHGPDIAGLPETGVAWPSWAEQGEGWLIHCTRSADGGWPGQSRHQHLDDLLLGDPGDEDPRFESLRRIVRGRRLVASAVTTSRSHPVVCFSAVPLRELLGRRRYRPHLHRWDYEPFGVAIRTRVAAAMGVCPAIYGVPAERSRLPPHDRYRFQAVGDTYDWTSEREWRACGTVDLNAVDPDDIRVFAPRRWTPRLAPLSPWPVDAVPTGDNS